MTEKSKGEQKICDLYGIKKIDGAFVGIELEMEGANLPGTGRFALPSTSAWKAVQDGSLREGIELVFREPLSALEVKEALAEMKGMFEQFGTKPMYSFRTSSHVHVNFSNMDPEVVKVFILLFILFENSLVSFCEKGRKGNRFCLRTDDSYDQVSIIRNFFHDHTIREERHAKYSALNLCTLRKYGTLEVRTLEGTCDWDRIYLWARTLLRLRKTAKDIGTRAKLLSMTNQELGDMVFNTEKLKSTFLKGDWQHDCDEKRSFLSELFRV